MKKVYYRKITVTAIMGALASVLMILEFSVPLVPSFIKFDFSDLPALIAAFSMGPLSGVAVVLIKNIVHLPFSSSAFVGEISNFILGCCFVLPSGILYKRIKNRKGAFIGAVMGAVLMSAMSLIVNYYLIYPVYARLFAPMDVIISAYSAIDPNVNNLWRALFEFNLPFTFIKGMANVAITFLIYKRLSPIIHGKRR